MTEHWAFQESQTLKTMWDGTPETRLKIARILGRSDYGVSKQARKLKLKSIQVVKEWTPEDIAELTHLWNELNLTADQICTKMNRSRNAIIGKARRLGLNRRDSPIKQTSASNPARVPRKPKSKESPKGISLLEMDPRGCRYPLWDDVVTHEYCGQPRGSHGSYCEVHRKKCIRKEMTAEEIEAKEAQLAKARLAKARAARKKSGWQSI